MPFAQCMAWEFGSYVIRTPSPGGRVLPYNKLHGDVPPFRVCFYDFLIINTGQNVGFLKIFYINRV